MTQINHSKISHRHCAIALFVCTKLWNVVHSKNPTDLKLKICSTKLLQVCVHEECNINEIEVNEFRKFDNEERKVWFEGRKKWPCPWT